MLHVCFLLFTSARALANTFVLASLPRWHAKDPDTILHRIAEDTFFPCADIRPPRNSWNQTVQTWQLSWGRLPVFVYPSRFDHWLRWKCNYVSLAAFPQPRHALPLFPPGWTDETRLIHYCRNQSARSVPYFLLPPSYIFAVTLIQLLGQDGCHHHAGGSCATLLSSKRRKRAMFLILSFGHYNVTQTNSLNANPPYYPVITNYPAPNSFKFEVAKQWTSSVFIAAIRQIRLFTTSSHSLGAQSSRPATCTSDPITLHSVVACSFKSHLNSINFLKKWVKGLERWRGNLHLIVRTSDSLNGTNT